MLTDWLKARADREDGQTLVEYTLILVLISMVAMGTLALLGGKVNDFLAQVKDAL